MLSDEERSFVQMDPHHLEEEIFVWADIRAQYADMEAELTEKEALLRIEVDSAKENMLRVQGSLVNFIALKENWTGKFDKAPTAAQATGWAVNHPDYIDAYTEYNRLRKARVDVDHEKNVVHAMVSSLDGKRKCLELANSSYISGYWGVSGENAVPDGKRKGVVKQQPTAAEEEYLFRKDRLAEQRAKRKLKTEN